MRRRALPLAVSLSAIRRPVKTGVPGADRRSLSIAVHASLTASCPFDFRQVWNPDSMEPSPVTFFLHLPKTAGTTFRSHVATSLHRDEALMLYQGRDGGLASRAAACRRVAGLSARRKSRLRVVFGHLVFAEMSRAFPDRPSRFVTFLREPVAHAASRYFFGVKTLKTLNRFRSGKFSGELLRDGSVVPMETWLRENPRHHDYMFRYLYSHLFEVRHVDVTPDEASFERLREALREFHLVGLVGHEDDELYLYHELGIRRFLGRKNVGRPKPPLRPEQREAILETHDWDLRLWEFAQELHGELVERPEYAAGVAEIRRRRDAVGPLQRRWHETSASLNRAVDRSTQAVAFALSRLLRRAR